MARKLFIVARGNVATYESLQRTVGREPDVEVLYDRRPAPPRTRLGRLRAGLGRLLSRRRGTAEERRTRQMIDEEIRRTGWAVVRREPAGDPAAPRASTDEARPPRPQPDPPASAASPGAPRLDHTRPRV